MKETELKPCPFCGGKAELMSKKKCYGHGEFITEHYVMCTECGVKGKPNAEYLTKKEDCITKCKEEWNRRADNEQR